jgi:hypothetical protein
MNAEKYQGPFRQQGFTRSSFKTGRRRGQAQFAPKTAHDHRGDGARPVPGGFETASTDLLGKAGFSR